MTELKQIGHVTQYLLEKRKALQNAVLFNYLGF